MEKKAEILQRDLVRLKRMVDYALCRSCLRAYILRYFGQKAEPDCHSCSNCSRQWEEKDVSVPAVSVLRLLHSLPCSYGMKMITDLLKGANTEKIRNAGLNRIPGYGALEDWPRAKVENLLEGLADYGWIEKTGDQYPVIQAAQCFYEAVREKKPVLIRSEQEKAGRALRTETDLDQDLFDDLRRVRMDLARRAGIPPYIIFNDKTLRQLSRIKPKTKEEMLEVQGIGEAKFKTYGSVFLEAIEKHEKK
ncbi:MAG: HRDC domain-containing protein [Erysipelotrichaceae bacterium]|nr:HRDC domain-containing protein [Erysipelotrichaceae bacterium]